MKAMTLAFVCIAIWQPSTCLAADRLQIEVASAQRGKDPKDTSIPQIDIRLTDRSRQEFGMWTSAHARQFIDVTVDGREVSRVHLLGPITAGWLIIGGLSSTDVEDLIQKLNGKAITVSVEAEE